MPLHNKKGNDLKLNLFIVRKVSLHTKKDYHFKLYLFLVREMPLHIKKDLIYNHIYFYCVNCLTQQK